MCFKEFAMKQMMSQRTATVTYMGEVNEFENDHVLSAPLYTSLESYDVGTRHEADNRSDFDTPTCIEMWRRVVCA